MEYMLINHTDPNGPGPAPGTPEFEEFMGRWMAYNQKLIDGGHWVSGASLAAPDTATTVQKADNQVTGTVDGPYAETKEVFSGYYLITADDLDIALAFAKEMPVATGFIEVRPVAFRPDA